MFGHLSALFDDEFGRCDMNVGNTLRILCCETGNGCGAINSLRSEGE